MKKILALGIVFALFAYAVHPLVSSALTLNRQLELGMVGSDVSALQTFLASDISIYPEGLVTGYFGPLTRAAVARFQARNSIAQVGRVGPITMTALQNTGSLSREAPTIGSVSVGTTNSTATLSWYTNQPASAVVYYSMAPIQWTEADAAHDVTISGNVNLVSIGLTNTHTAYLSGLQPNTTYNYVIYVRNGTGDVSVTMPTTFHTN